MTFRPTGDRRDEPSAQALLVIAHPGHELRLYGWLRQVHPDVVILTSGAGRTGRPRTDSSHRVLDEVGASPSGIFGRHSDRAIYSAFLRRQTPFFIELAAELASVLRSKPYTVVVADPLEGYSPTHDLCRVLVDTVIRRVCAGTDRIIESYDYALTQRIATRQSDDICISLEDTLLAMKLKAACSYPELADEVGSALQFEGVAQQAEEVLRRLPPATSRYLPMREPFYEQYGEYLQAAGKYPSVIRCREHFVPVANALVQWAGD